MLTHRLDALQSHDPLAWLDAPADPEHGIPLQPAGMGRHALLTLLAGPALILDLGTVLAGHAVLRGCTVLYVDAANAFDPYLLSRLARDAGRPPKAILQRLHLSRAFTCHQLEAILMGILVEHQKAITQLKGRVRELQGEKLSALSDQRTADGDQAVPADR